MLGGIGCNSRAVDMGAAPRQKGRVSGMKRRGEITSKKITARERKRRKFLCLLRLLEWRRVLRERRCNTRTKRKVFCQQRLLATVRWRPPLFDQKPCFPPTLFPDLSTNRLRLPVASRECKRWGFWCCHRACLSRFSRAGLISTEFQFSDTVDSVYVIYD